MWKWNYFNFSVGWVPNRINVPFQNLGRMHTLWFCDPDPFSTDSVTRWRVSILEQTMCYAPNIITSKKDMTCACLFLQAQKQQLPLDLLQVLYIWGDTVNKRPDPHPSEGSLWMDFSSWGRSPEAFVCMQDTSSMRSSLIVGEPMKSLQKKNILYCVLFYDTGLSKKVSVSRSAVSESLQSHGL